MSFRNASACASKFAVNFGQVKSVWHFGLLLFSPKAIFIIRDKFIAFHRIETRGDIPMLLQQ